MKSESASSVTVVFSGPEKKGGHFMYSIVGADKNGEFNTVRRYSDFSNLRSTLSAKWPGFYIPTLPQKKFLGIQDSTFIEIRKHGLEHFIHSLKQLQHLWYTEETQLFLRKIGDTQKQLQKMKQTTINQTLERYKQQFPHLFDKQTPKELNNQIMDFSQYLKKAKGLLQSLQKMTEQIFTSRKKFNQKYLNLVSTIIPDYETSCMQVYRNQNNFEELIFTGSKRQKMAPFIEEFRKKKNSALLVLQEIRREKEQIMGFEEVLKTREYYTSQKQKAISKIKDLQIETTKIHSGKESIMSKIKGKSKEEQLKANEASIQKVQEEEKNLGLLCEVLTLILGSTEINKFKSFRERAYYVLLKKLFELQREESRLKKQFWSLVLKENHEKEELDNFFDHSPAKESEKKAQVTEAESEEPKSESQVQTQENQHQQLQEEDDEEPQQVQITNVEEEAEQIKSESHEPNEQNQANDANEPNKPNEANEPNQANEANEPNEANDANEANQPNESNESNEPNESNESNEQNEPKEQNEEKYEIQ